MKRISSLVFLALCLMISPTLFADDTDVFGGGGSPVPPNVLIIFDSSGTMNDLILHEPFSLSKNYLGLLGSSDKKYDENYIYYLEGVSAGGHENNTYQPWPPGSTIKKDTSLKVSALSSTTVAYCPEMKAALYYSGTTPGSTSFTGWFLGRIATASPHGCSTASAPYHLYTGKYLNYLTYIYNADPGTLTTSTKLAAAVDSIFNVVHSTLAQQIRIGVMKYNSQQQGQGAEMVVPISDTNTPESIMAAIQTGIVDQKSDTVADTPLAESLAEAGLYFAGKPSWSSQSDSAPYTSPVKYRCQNNYVIILTDGDSSMDRGENNRKHNIFKNTGDKDVSLGTYYFGTPMGSAGDTDGDGMENVYDPVTEGTHNLDDVARFLATTDLITGRNDDAGVSFDQSPYAVQTVKTYVIGFGDAIGDTAFLKRVADATHGQGDYAEAKDGTTLLVKFQDFLGKIIEANSTFIAPVVPVNRLNKVYSGDSVYISLFKPQDKSAFWLGNIKKYGLSTTGVLKDKSGNDATDASTGLFKAGATSVWSAGTDGSNTEYGGAGAALMTYLLGNHSRTFYTHWTANGTTLAPFSDSSSEILTQLKASNPTDPAYTDAWAQDVVHYATATGIYSPLSTTSPRSWVLGDVLHSKPATMFDGTDTILFAGANDGFLHCFVDSTGSDTTQADDTVSEAWAFAPWEVIPRLHSLHDTLTHHYYVDGSPTIYDLPASNERYITFGLRRGGRGYTTLDIGNLNASTKAYSGGYDTPAFAWEISSNHLVSDGAEPLGQSWATPKLATVKTSSSSSVKALILAGGYDAPYEDLLAKGSTTRTMGRAVYAVDASDGSVLANLNFNHGKSGSTDMTGCILEVSVFDWNNDSFDDTVYAGSLAGEVFAFTDRDANGSWGKLNLFQAPSATSTTMDQKFEYEPDIATETWGDYVFIGSGDREHPTTTSTVNRFYGLKNTWVLPTAPNALTESNLVDVTDYTYSAATLEDLETESGWFIRLVNEGDEVNGDYDADQGHVGEKVVSSPLLYNGIAFFTTYTPVGGAASGDLCTASELGQGRLYALDYKTGKAAMDLYAGNNSAGVVKILRRDRWTDLGVGIPSPPTLVVTKDGGPMLIIGTGEGAKTFQIPNSSKAKMYYWKQK